MKKVLLLLIAAFTLSSCYIDRRDENYLSENPILKLVATDPSGKSLMGAYVILYASQGDYDNDARPVREGWTNSHGEIIFDNLYEIVYYFDVYYEDRNVRLSNYGGIVKTRYALKRGETTVVPVRTFLVN